MAPVYRWPPQTPAVAGLRRQTAGLRPPGTPQNSHTLCRPSLRLLPLQPGVAHPGVGDSLGALIGAAGYGAGGGVGGGVGGGAVGSQERGSEREADLVTSDAHRGLKDATATVFAGASWQRCRTHFMSNLLFNIPRRANPGWRPS